MDKKKVLIVEDDMLQRTALKIALTENGFEVFRAKNGEEGLNMAFKHKPDVILSDIMMPKMDGIQMIEELRKDSWGEQVPIIVSSNVSDMEKIQEAIEHEVFIYFVKSNVPLEEVVERVKGSCK